MKPSPFQTPRATPSRGRLKDAGLPLSRRPDSNSGESKIPKIAAKGAGASEDPSRRSIDFADQSPKENSVAEELHECPIQNLLPSFEVDDDGFIGSGVFGGRSSDLFPVKEEEEDEVGVPVKDTMEGAGKEDCPAAAAEAPATTSKGKSLYEKGGSMECLFDAATQAGIRGGGVSRETDVRSGLLLPAKVRIGVVSFLIGWVAVVNILAVSAVFGCGRCGGDDEVFSGLPPT